MIWGTGGTGSTLRQTGSADDAEGVVTQPDELAKD